MKPLSFEEWHKNKYKQPPFPESEYIEPSDMNEYGDYRAQLAWDEAAKAQRDACADCVPPSNYYFEAIKNAPLVEYKETL